MVEKMKKVFVVFNEWFPVPELLNENSDVSSKYYIPETLAKKYEKAMSRFLSIRSEVLDYTKKQKKKNNDNPPSN